MRRLQAFLLVSVLVGAAAASATARSPQPVVGHPNPLLTNLSLDYVAPIPAPNGGAATLAPLEPGVIEASVRDMSYLRYESAGDWGGFESAPVGWLALKDGGAVIVGGRQKAEVPHFANEADGRVQSFTYLHGIGLPRKSKPSTPVSSGPPLPTTTPTPCPNSGFGGTACGGGGGSGSHGKQGGSGGKGNGGKGNGGKGNGGPSNSAGDCGTAGISIDSNLPRCRIYVVNQAPGDGTFEHLTITNTSSRRYTLSLRATGTQSPLWSELQMGIWRTGSSAPTPLPPLHFWTTQFTQLVTLAANQSVRYTIELYLPASTGNEAQHESAVVDFVWRAAS